MQGDLARRRGDFAAAQSHLDESLAIAREIGDRASEGWGLVALARFERSRGRPDDALVRGRSALALAEEHTLPGVEAAALDVFVGVARDRREPETAARLAAAAEAVRGMMPSGPDAERDADVDWVRTALGEARFAAAWAEGLALTPAARRALARCEPRA
jgi:hypothetical protein